MTQDEQTRLEPTLLEPTPLGPTPGSAADLTAPADPESVVRTIVLTALTAAPRSRAQLESKLAAKGAPPDVAARVLDRFEQVGLVDDAEFARSLVRSRQASRGLAGRALRQELRRSGVGDETAADARPRWEWRSCPQAETWLLLLSRTPSRRRPSRHGYSPAGLALLVPFV